MLAGPRCGLPWQEDRHPLISPSASIDENRSRESPSRVPTTRTTQCFQFGNRRTSIPPGSVGRYGRPVPHRAFVVTELKELRGDFNKFARDTGERVSSLESQVRYGVTGNGQPSRLQVVEERVESLSRWRWWVVGCAAGSGAVISVIAWMVGLKR